MNYYAKSSTQLTIRATKYIINEAVKSLPLRYLIIVSPTLSIEAINQYFGRQFRHKSIKSIFKHLSLFYVTDLALNHSE